MIQLYSGIHNYLYIFMISSIDASELYSHFRFMFAKSLSIGLSSGEYGGKKSKLAPQAVINVSVCRLLWKDALSKMTTCDASSSGHNTFSSHALKASVSQAPSKSTGAVKRPWICAAMSVVLLYRLLEILSGTQTPFGA